ncbi:MAG: right-handed parallel beta-helix repeat-containing protein [Haloarculaceae archaeon]
MATLTAAGTLAGLADRVRGETTAERYQEYFSRFGTVIDASDVGADATGGESINPLLEEHVADDTLLMFPPGEYLMTEQFRFTDYRNVGIVGNDATIVPGTVEAMDGRLATAGTFSGPTRLFRLGVSYAPGDELRFEGLTFDFTADNSGFRAIEAYVKRDMLVRDVDVTGRHDLASFGPALFSVTDPDGISTVEGFRAPDGGAFSEDTLGDIWRGPTGILVPRSHEGKLWFRDCELGGFPDNGLYASSTAGRVVVKGGTYKNSNASNIRLYGDYSYVKDATVVVDAAEDGHNQPGIRLDDGQHLWVYNTDVELTDPNGDAIIVKDDVDSARIQDCTITVGEGRMNYAVLVHENAGVVDVFDTEITFDGTGNAIYVEGHNDDSDAPVKLLRTTITGDGSGEDGRNAIRLARSGVDVEDVTVKMTGPDYRRGLVFLADDCTLDGGLVEATHYPVVNAANGTRIDDVTLRSYGRYQGLKLYDGYADVTVTDSEIYNDVLDRGTENLVLQNNTYPSS